ncbi:MAG: hypothetical protein HY322_03255 [Betaproteobacteria bacterium]|nr:hypothetical protein [Betaproteobacteria bacterium]
MSVTVVDASAIAAVLFDEPEAAPIIGSVTGALIASGLMRYELASICAIKLARKAPLVTLDSRLAKAYDRAAARTGLS